MRKLHKTSTMKKQYTSNCITCLNIEYIVIQDQGFSCTDECVCVCVSDLQVLWMHGEKGQGLAQFYIPHSVTVDSYQRVCVHPHFCFWITSTPKRALPQIRWVWFFLRFGEMCLSNGCSAVNGCRQNESQWMLCSEWVPSEWESDKNITALQSIS